MSEAQLLALANQFAQAAHKSRVISHRTEGGSFIFVLESGQKYSYTVQQLENAAKAMALSKAGESEKPALAVKKPKAVKE